jgi:hypothetical protein
VLEIAFTDAKNAHWMRRSNGVLESRDISAVDEMGRNRDTLFLTRHGRRSSGEGTAGWLPTLRGYLDG